MKFEKINKQKTRLSAGFRDNSGSEFPDVTEQAFFISEALGRVPSDPSRGMISTLASTFAGDGLSTHILSPTDSSATLLSADYSSTKNCNKQSLRSFQDLKKEASYEASSRVGSMYPPRPINDNNILTQNSKDVNTSMAESGGHDPHPAEPNDSFIGRSPTQWDSLSNHSGIITRRVTGSKATIPKPVKLNRLLSFDKLRIGMTIILYSLFIIHYSPPAYAQTPTPSFGPPAAGLTQIEEVFRNVIKISVGGAFIALFVVLVWAGIKFLTSGGEPKALESARDAVTWALLGILFLALAWLILKLIAAFTGIPDLTSFNIKVLCPGCP